MISFFFNDTATTEIYTLSLHDALPIFDAGINDRDYSRTRNPKTILRIPKPNDLRCGLRRIRSEEHTSELQSQSNLVCRLLLEKKNNAQTTVTLIDGRVALRPSGSLPTA